MKKKLKIALAIVLFALAGFLSYTIAIKLMHKSEVAKRVKTLPDFSFKTINGNTFTHKDLKTIPTIFVYFNSDCDYCKSEATKIRNRLSDFKGTQLIFISYESKENIINFAKTYKLLGQDNVIFLEDNKGVFSQIFDVNSIPYIVIYNSNKEFKRKFKGATKIDKILKELY